MKKLTITQERLLQLINKEKPESGVFEYDKMKDLCIEKCKTFDLTFNALLFKGYILHFTTNKNTFITKVK